MGNTQSLSNDGPSYTKPIKVTFDGVIGAGKTSLLENTVTALQARGYHVVKASEPVELWKSSGLLRRMYEDIGQINSLRAQIAEAERSSSSSTPIEESNESADEGLSASPIPSAGASAVLKDLQESLLRRYGWPAMFQVFAFATRLTEFMNAQDEAMAFLKQTNGEKPVVLLCERSIQSDRLIFKHMLKAAGYITDDQEKVYEACFSAFERLASEFIPDLAVFVNTSVEESMARIKGRARAGETVSIEYQRDLWQRHQELFTDKSVFAQAPVFHVDGLVKFHESMEDVDSLVGDALQFISSRLPVQ